jgi:protein-L-isoaspartate(D-aspartate) O-methyltransferase
MNFELARRKMVIEQLEQRGIHDPRVLEAMEWVPRHEFVPHNLLHLAYNDRAVPIGHEQTISQPYTVAFMCQEARVADRDRILEIGTGSGYAAALLSLLSQEVHTIERIEVLYEPARERLARLGYNNVYCHLDDGSHGLPSDAPFDAIIVAAGAETLPEALHDQLADGGRLIIPIGPLAHQQMYRLTRRGHDFIREDLGSFGFVPLIRGAECHPEEA